MHDIDRVLLEAPSSEQEQEDEQFLEQEDEQFLFEDEAEHEHEHEHEHVLTEAQEVELANELLEVGSEQSLEHFISDLFSAAADRAGRFARSRTGRQLGGILKQAALKSLPVIGAGVGGSVAGQRGERAGRALGNAARCFGVDLEGMTAEDREFELARHFVRLGDCATRQALQQLNSGPPAHVARRAMTLATRRHAPGLPLNRILTAPPMRRIPPAEPSLAAEPVPQAPAAPRRARSAAAGVAPRSTGACPSCGSPLGGRTGRWIKRGNAVVLLSD
jgi:hypothetical protein